MFRGRFLSLFLALGVCLTSTAVADNEWEEMQVDCNSNPSTLWEDYVCQLKNGPAIQENCHPRYILSPKRKPKGLIVAFHGYTACPDSFESMVEAWVPAGYDVLIPLLVGNGREAGDCAKNTSAVYDNFTVCVDEFRIDGLPLSRKGYIDFVDTINEIVKEEKERRKIRQVFVAGLSHGGPLGSYAISSGKGLYDGNIAMNAFFGFSSPGTDRDFTLCIKNNLTSLECADSLTGQIADTFDVGLAPGGFQEFVTTTIQENLPDEYSYEDYAVVNAVIRRVMTELAENFDALPENELKVLINEATLNWGPNCLKENANGRGGICGFRLRNLFATHSFAMFAHRLTGSYRSARARVQFVTTERDAGTRNSLNVQAAQNEIRSSKEQVSICMHRIVPLCNLTGSGNECGVPHSMLSRAEQELASPGELYWEPAIQGNSTRYFKNRVRMGTRADTFDAFTVREDCVQLHPVVTQDPSLILPPFRGLWIRIDFDEASGPLDAEQQASVAQSLYEALDLQSGAVIPTNLEVVSGESFCLDGLVQDFYLEFPSDQVSEHDLEELEEQVMRDGILNNTLGSEVLELEVAGRRPLQQGDEPKRKKRAGMFRNEKSTSKSASSSKSASKSKSGCAH